MTWVLLGLLAAVLIAAMLLLQEHFKIDGVALAFWCKIACVTVTLPFVIYYGLPSDWRFYAWLFPQAAIFAVSDVLTFRILPEIGAGVLSRVLPGTVVTSFFLWFAIAPEELKQLVDKPVIAAAIFAVVCGAGWFASRLTKCEVTMRAVRRLWFPLVGNTLSPVLAKITTRYADTYQGAFGFTFAEALMMIAIWVVWLYVAKPIPFKNLVAKETVKKSLIVGMVTSIMVVTIVASYYFIDNPGYVSALQLIYAAIIMGVHKWMDKKDGSDVVSGAGIVACAMVLILLKAQLGP
jgi:hypothetical protein